MNTYFQIKYGMIILQQQIIHMKKYLSDAQKAALKENGSKGGIATQELRRTLQSFKIKMLVSINEQEKYILTQTLAKKLSLALFSQSVNITELAKHIKFTGNNSKKLSTNLDSLANRLAEKYRSYVDLQMTEQIRKML
ncbi:hypothetical protein [Pseudomonas oryzihabitans]|uniref:Uncharacterized protein n=1 Tax=Pseudomonas oryzihabitans TaxID=47885 RepID=A0AAJ2EXF3_9PSED|nr:hypothetical protein [Pseudomonas psychrotolerans]MDR6234416.1 hypothetical protein [Pseudomonas psychrotolerans]MDR6356458.1 hypothetical protein [Pseudomonas psychrotolerans]